MIFYVLTISPNSDQQSTHSNVYQKIKKVIEKLKGEGIVASKERLEKLGGKTVKQVNQYGETIAFAVKAYMIDDGVINEAGIGLAISDEEAGW